MTENSTLIDGDEAAASSLPAFLTDYAPTRYRRRWTPLSRSPATARLGEVWQVAAQRATTQRVIADRPADIDPEGPADRDYAGWAELVEQAAGWLHAAGIRPWDRVAVLKANHLDVSLLASAIARLGAIPATLGWTHTPEFARAMLTRLDQPFLVADSTQLQQCGLDEDAVAALTRRTITVDRTDRRDVVALDDLRGAPPGRPRLRAGNEPMLITHTSGTTGIPKLVLHSAESIHSLALVEAERWPVFGLRPRDTVAYCDPFFHQRMATAMAAVATLTPNVLMLSEPESPVVRELLAEHRPTIVETLPNIYLRWESLASDHARPFGNVRVYVNSFDAEALRQRTLGQGVEVVTGDATAMPFEAARFSAVVSFTMLHHIPSPQSQDRLLAEVCRVLRPGGVFAGSDSTTNFLFRLAHLGDTMVLVDPDRFASRLQAVGFTDARVQRGNRAFGFRAIRPHTPPGT